MMSEARGAHLKQALDAIRRNDFDAALRAANELLAFDADDAATCQLAALAALKGGHHSEALMLAKRSLALAPAHGPTLMIYGRAAAETGDDAEAAAAFRQAAEAMPSEAEPLFLLCAMLLKSGHPEARAVLEYLEAEFPRHAAGWAEMGTVLVSAQRTEAALLCFDRAAEIAPSFDLAWRRGLVLQTLGRTADATQAFEAAIRFDPRSAAAHLQLALCWRDLGQIEAAEAAARAAVAIDPALGGPESGADASEDGPSIGELRRTFVA